MKKYGFVLGCTALLAFASVEAFAAPKKAAARKTAPVAPVQAPATSAGGVFAGLSVSGVSQYGYAGAVYALNGNTALNGWLLRGSVGAGNFNYRSGVTPSGVVNGTTSKATLGIGYQHFVDSVRLSGFIGPAYSNQNINANDPANRTSGTAYGGHGQIELTAPLGTVANLGLIGSFTSGHNDYYSNASVGFPVHGSLQIGPEVSFLGSRSYSAQRYGTFAGLPIPGIKNLNVKAGAGFQRTIGRGTGTSEAYGAVGFGYTY